MEPDDMYTPIELPIFGWGAFPIFFSTFSRFHNGALRGTELYVAQLPVLEYNLNYGDDALSEQCDNSQGSAPINYQHLLLVQMTLESQRSHADT
jgi:hypothetical protein